MRVDITEATREYEGFFQLDRVVLRHLRFDGEMSRPVSRLVFERGDSVAVLLYDSSRDVVVLVEQFRYPVYLRDEGEGRLWEVVAGTIEPGKSPEEVARAELVEEAGYELRELERLGTFYVSPGACTERIVLFLGQLASATRVGSGGGKPGSDEDIAVHEVSFESALEMVYSGSIRDAKTIIALLHLALRRKKDVVG
jgi:ADP-ribose pyrophosphatase